MKTITILLTAVILSVMAFTSCTKEVTYPSAPFLDHPVSATARPGSVIPENPGQKEVRELQRQSRKH